MESRYEDKGKDISCYDVCCNYYGWGFAITNSVYLEKFYITNKKEKLLQVGNAILDPNYIVDFRNLEMQNNAEIVIKNRST